MKKHASRFFNRDLSWLDFNFRVLTQALDPRTPLLERLRFSDIFRSNNDEFFMKRVGSLVKKIKFLDEHRLYLDIREKCREQMSLFSKNFKNQLLPRLREHDIHLLSWSQLDPGEQERLVRHFKENLFPILTPLAVDTGHPFPFLSNLSKSVAVCLKERRSKKNRFARVKIPTEIPQWFRLEKFRFVNIDEIILANIASLFPGMTIKHQNVFRVTRNAAMDEDGDDAEDKMEWVEEGLKERKFAPVVRLELADHSDSWISKFLLKELQIGDHQIYDMPTIANHTSFNMIHELDLPGLKYPKFAPSNRHFEDLKNPSMNIFDHIRKKDHLVHFPYESYHSTTQNFVKVAAEDPEVMGIKIVLYRTDSDGSLVDTLIRASENQKQVACIIELTARFDEARNIHWAQKLEEAGVHVSYGLMEYKTHAKMIVVVRKDRDGIRTYVNIGTGNYNSQTSKIYTDLSFFTCKKEISQEVLEVFNFLTGRSLKKDYKTLLVAPFNMFKTFKELVEEETRIGTRGRIVAKMNQLQEPSVIESLYKASQAGVQITLIVRGFCSLRPQVKGLSENIRLFSIVGRLLEHNRIYYFGKGRPDPVDGRFYIGSADWMSRNLHERMEIVAPVDQKDLKKELWDYLELCSRDNRNLWELDSRGEYTQSRPEGSETDSQTLMIKKYESP